MPASSSSSSSSSTTTTTTASLMFSKLRLTRNLVRIQALQAKYPELSQARLLETVASDPPVSQSHYITPRNTNTVGTSTSPTTTTATTITTVSFSVCNQSQSIVQQRYTLHSSLRSRRGNRHRNAYRHSHSTTNTQTPLIGGNQNNKGSSTATVTTSAATTAATTTAAATTAATPAAGTSTTSSPRSVTHHTSIFELAMCIATRSHTLPNRNNLSLPSTTTLSFIIYPPLLLPLPSTFLHDSLPPTTSYPLLISTNPIPSDNINPLMKR